MVNTYRSAAWSLLTGRIRCLIYFWRNFSSPFFTERQEGWCDEKLEYYKCLETASVIDLIVFATLETYSCNSFFLLCRSSSGPLFVRCHPLKSLAWSWRGRKSRSFIAVDTTVLAGLRWSQPGSPCDGTEEFGCNKRSKVYSTCECQTLLYRLVLSRIQCGIRCDPRKKMRIRFFPLRRGFSPASDWTLSLHRPESRALARPTWSSSPLAPSNTLPNALSFSPRSLSFNFISNQVYA